MPDNIIILSPDESRNGELIVTSNDYERLMEAFLDSLDVREKTRETYRWGMTRFFRWIQETGRQLGCMTPADIVRFKAYLLRSDLSTLTVGSYLTAVRQFYKWTEINLIYKNIARSVSPAKGKKGIRKMHLTEEEVSRMLSILQAKSKRDFALVNLIIRTGLRTIEVERANIGDVVRKDGHRILKVWGKGREGKEDFVILNDPAWIPLRDYLKTRLDHGKDAPLFVTEGKGHRGSRLSRRQIQHLCKCALSEIGLEGHEYSAHSLRHTTAVYILKRGGDWKDVQRVLRHISPATSQIYTATIEDEIRLKRNPEALLDDAFKISNM